MVKEPLTNEFLHTVGRYLKDDLIGLKLAQNPDGVYQLDNDVLIELRTMRQEAELILQNPAAADAIVQGTLIRQLGPERASAIGVPRLLSEMTKAMADVHAILDAFWNYVPLSHRQLGSSDGRVKNFTNPADLLPAIFYPHEVRAGRPVRRWKTMEAFRSLRALRAWFMAVDWIEPRHVTKEGKHKMKSLTEELERDTFWPEEDEERTDTLFFRFDPTRGFLFKELVDGPGKYVASIKLSCRYIQTFHPTTGEVVTVRVWYAARVKQLGPLWRRHKARKGSTADQAAATLIFESREDFELVLPMLEVGVLHRASVKIKNEKRKDGNDNPFSTSVRGVHWSGHINFGGVQTELECSDIGRYLNSVFSLTMFNHAVYEVLRLIQPLEKEQSSQSMWELLFPEQHYTKLTTELKVRMIKRQLKDVAESFEELEHYERQVGRTIRTLRKFLLEHPDAINNPNNYPELILP